MENQSNVLLKVTGILMIIGGIIAIIVSIIAILGASALALLVGGAVGILVLAALLSLVSAVVELVAGIVGAKNAAKPEKAQTCIIFGILVIVLSVLGNVITKAAGGDFSIVNLGLGVIIPILYLIGAYQNKSKAG